MSAYRMGLTGKAAEWAGRTQAKGSSQCLEDCYDAFGCCSQQFLARLYVFHRLNLVSHDSLRFSAPKILAMLKTIVGKTSEVCFSIHFDNPSKNLKKSHP